MKRGRQRLVTLLGVLSSALFVALAVRKLSFSDVSGAFTGARLWPWVPIAILLYLAGHVIRGVRCKRLVSREAQLPLPTATNVVVLGYAVNNVLPARLGELARAAMLSQKSGLPYVQSLVVTGLERILDGLVLVMMLVVSSLMLPRADWIRATLEVGALVFGVATAGVLIAVLAPTWLFTMASRVGERLGPRAHDALVGIVHQISSAFAYVRDLRSAIRVLALSVAVWTAEAGMFVALLPAFGLKPNPWLAILVMTVTNLGILVPSTPGFVGPFHYFCMRALAAFAVSESTAFSYAVLAHLSFYVPITIWGMIVLVSYGVSLSSLAAEAAAARPLAPRREALASSPPPPTIPAAEPAPFTLALIETWLPLEADGLDAAERREVLLATAHFVEAEIAELPARLAWLHATALGMFRVLTALVHLRTFCNLRLARRRDWVERWAFGSFNLGRQLFRATRTTALVGYYEHPIVQRHLGVLGTRSDARDDGKLIALHAGGARR